MSHRLLIRAATHHGPDGPRRTDVLVAGGKIEEVRDGIPSGDVDRVIDADDLAVLPGIIDPHTHFGIWRGSTQAADDFLAGSAAAAAGGVTTYMNFAPQEPGQSLHAAIAAERSRADGQTWVDYGLHVSFGTPSPTWRRELAALAAAGVTSLKVYTTYRGSIFSTSDWDWAQLMQAAGEHGLLVMVHAENDGIVEGATADALRRGETDISHHAAARPAIAETAAVGHGIALVHATGCPLYFVHLSSPTSVALVDLARTAGLPVFAESCAHHLTLDERRYAQSDAWRVFMTPPLRSRADVDRLATMVAEGSIDTAGSDHCGYTAAQRSGDRDMVTALPGIPGVETLWPVLHTELVVKRGIALSKVCALVSANPAAIFGLRGKGTLAPGADADIVLFDPDDERTLDERTLISKAGYSSWHGHRIKGRVVRTISRGRTVFADGRIVDDQPSGRFVACDRFSAPRVAPILDKNSDRPAIAPGLCGQCRRPVSAQEESTGV